MNLIFIGPQGSGKGTQAKIISEKLNLCHISTGDLLREAVKEGSKLGKKAKQYIDGIISSGFYLSIDMYKEVMKKIEGM